MSEQLLTVLKFCLLALLYLFFLRVLRAVWTEISPPKIAVDPASATPRRKRSAKAPKQPAPSPRARKTSGVPTALVVIEPHDRSGLQYSLGPEETIGRSPGCSIVFDEQYVSQVHARLFIRGATLFVEDLGSTNGTWVNGARAVGQMPVRAHDRIQVGNLIMEAR